MDTKWKKSKAVCGFLSFALGVSLLLTALLPLAGDLFSESGRGRLKSALQSDFQETEAFRSYLSEMMGRFIAMGAGGPLDGYYSDPYAAYDLEDAILIEAEAATVVQDGGEWYFDGYPVGDYQPTESDRERWRKEAEAWNRAIQEDKNILYIVKKGDTVLYTNLDSTHYDHANRPAGHNFILSFAEGKCIVANQGKSIPIYGTDNNGLYVDDGEHWYLPGYSNFPAGAEAEDVAVYMAVADVPALYIKGNYGSQGTQWRCNRLYYLEKNWRERRQSLVVNSAVCLGVGLLSLLAWFVLRREKPAADRAIARLTGHIWFEVKLLLFLGAVFFALFPLTEEMRYLVQEVTYATAWEETAYYQYPWFLGSYFYEVLRRPGALLPAFWCGWLFVNDIRYGDRPWRHGVWGMLTDKSLKLPIQKRLSRRAAASVLLPVLALLLFFPGFRLLNTRGVNFYLAFVAWGGAELLLLFVMQCLYAKKNAALAQDLGALTDHIAAVKEGDLTFPLPLPQDSDLRRSVEELRDIQQGMKKAVEEQTRSERMKVELVTNVSHDIKTPLTSIISYAELLRQEGLEPPAGEYVDILCQKAERLRSMVLDVFEVSKAASGELPVKLEKLDLAKLLRQTLADMEQQIDAAPVQLRPSLPQGPVFITADGDRLYRVFQNLLQNALAYALEGSRVYLSLTVRDGVAEASVKNTSKTELPEGVDFTARFVRGDESRTDGGSGLGLAIADSFTRACGGELRVEPVADLFVVKVAFPLSQDKPGEPAD